MIYIVYIHTTCNDSVKDVVWRVGETFESKEPDSVIVLQASPFYFVLLM